VTVSPHLVHLDTSNNKNVYTKSGILTNDARWHGSRCSNCPLRTIARDLVRFGMEAHSHTITIANRCHATARIANAYRQLLSKGRQNLEASRVDQKSSIFNSTPFICNEVDLRKILLKVEMQSPVVLCQGAELHAELGAQCRPVHTGSPTLQRAAPTLLFSAALLRRFALSLPKTQASSRIEQRDGKHLDHPFTEELR
jgi:hypothetical protein